MAADSLPRRLAKYALAPYLNERFYGTIHALSMARDIRFGIWKEPELDLIAYAVRAGETALDIGANYGLYSYYLSRALGHNGRVYAFEPIPYTVNVFKTVARLLRFGNVELVEKACGETAGLADFNIPIANSGAIIAGIVHMGTRNNERPGKERHARFQQTRGTTCEVIRIDDYLKGVRDISFLKCDIEGADLYALRGAVNTIRNHRPLVVCEINPWFLEGFGLKVDDLADFFSELGYHLYRYDSKRLRPKSPADIEEDNWIFVHPSRIRRVESIIARDCAPDHERKPPIVNGYAQETRDASSSRHR